MGELSPLQFWLRALVLVLVVGGIVFVLLQKPRKQDEVRDLESTPQDGSYLGTVVVGHKRQVRKLDAVDKERSSQIDDEKSFDK